MEQKKDYGIWIKIVSVAIPVVVAILFGVRVDYDLPVFLPPIYATINAITALLLVLALVAIKAKKNTTASTLNAILHCSIVSVSSYVYCISYDN